MMLKQSHIGTVINVIIVILALNLLIPNIVKNVNNALLYKNSTRTYAPPNAHVQYVRISFILIKITSL